MVGGAVEYLALVSGYQALLVVLGGLYVLAWVFASRVRLLADRDLVQASEAGSAPPSAPSPEPAAG
jgi:hypothetical protein